MTEAQQQTICELLETLNPTTVRHGACKGADTQFHQLAFLNSRANIIIHPPTDKRHATVFGRGSRITILPDDEYHVRNRAIVDATKTLIAAPKEAEEQPRGGTWYTVRYARSVGKDVMLVKPDGTVRLMNG